MVKSLILSQLSIQLAEVTEVKEGKYLWCTVVGLFRLLTRGRFGDICRGDYPSTRHISERDKPMKEKHHSEDG